MRGGLDYAELWQSKSWLALQQPAGPLCVRAFARRYVEACAVEQFMPETLRARSTDLARFADWCEERGLDHPRDVTKPILERFQRHLFYYRKVDGQPLGAGRQRQHLHHLQLYFRWLVQQNHIGSNPAADLTLPRVPLRRLIEPLSVAEVEAILAVPNVDEPIGLRDRAILEVFYSTGLRRAEVRNLTLYDIDASTGTVFVRQGKGRKDRVVPIGERALAWVQKYLDEARGELVVDPQEQALFVGRDGRPLHRSLLGWNVRDAVKRAGITKRGACHLFRHAMATQMLENGADVRYIQEMLGHAKLDTTQMYTHVSIGKLKAVHAATHPAAKLKRKRAKASDTADDDDAAPAA